MMHSHWAPRKISLNNELYQFQFQFQLRGLDFHAPKHNKFGNSNARQKENYATPLIWKSADHELETKHNNKFTNKYVIYEQ